ncbi:FecCD family ABC transporter permease [Paenibacillus sp. GCM10012307]|uniref:Iron ABC transporter permease n=1 Tax=Paenibacillus roseus TaxID=2798579 RepID=A0A934J1A3_9BACL|nr:iron ABC transporter permease [Paenibacillus roseus]MBJ6362971.1 iron ABC transporter permease [Paenibacillus roseus]
MIGLLLLNILIFLSSVALGNRDIPFLDAWATVLGLGSDTYAFTIRQLRLPRVWTGFLAGCGLALSGAVLQVVTRNPLASPGVIGINAGAAAAVVTVLVLVPAFPTRQLPLVAFLGALAATAVIYSLALRKGGTMERMLLAGVGITAMAGAWITYLLTVAQVFRVSQAYIWMAGSLYARTWDHVWSLFPWIIVLFAVALLYARRLDLLQLSDISASGLGIKLNSTRIVLILISAGLAGSSVSVAGTVAFVGLMAPHMATYLAGSSNLKRLPVAALLGGALVMLSDLTGRILIPPYELPVGLITALIGAPYMLYLLLRRPTAL